jgi:hypothetical protein
VVAKLTGKTKLYNVAPGLDSELIRFGESFVICSFLNFAIRKPTLRYDSYTLLVSCKSDKASDISWLSFSKSNTRQQPLQFGSIGGSARNLQDGYSGGQMKISVGQYRLSPHRQRDQRCGGWAIWASQPFASRTQSSAQVECPRCSKIGALLSYHLTMACSVTHPVIPAMID